MRRYVAESGRTSSGECISRKSGVEKVSPRIVIIIPKMIESEMLVWTIFWILFESFAPKLRPAVTFTPAEIPTNRFTNRFTSEPTEPTAASEVEPANLQMTATSAA